MIKKNIPKEIREDIGNIKQKQAVIKKKKNEITGYESL